jgi:hypothetical protein
MEMKDKFAVSDEPVFERERLSAFIGQEMSKKTESLETYIRLWVAAIWHGSISRFALVYQTYSPGWRMATSIGL